MSTLIARIEKKHKGYKVIAGPFAVNSTPAVQKSERAACVRALRAQVEGSKIVIWGREAFVLRPAKGWAENHSGSEKPAIKSVVPLINLKTKEPE